MGNEKKQLLVLKKTRSELEERNITALREKYLYDNLIFTSFDYEKYLHIHKMLFEGIYPFAGQIRTCWLRKGYTSFLNPLKIKRSLSSLLNRMNLESERIQNNDEYMTFISYYFYQLNLIHPFEEGNGRTQRFFFSKFIDNLNKKIEFGQYAFNYDNFDSESKSSFNVAIMLKSIGEDDEWYELLLEEMITYTPCKVKKK